MTYGNGHTLALSYDRRLRLARWDVAGLMGWEYDYAALGEKTGRVSYAGNLYDPTLDRSYEYDHVGRLVYATTGSNARAVAGRGGVPEHEGPYSHTYSYDERGNLTERQGWGGWNASSAYPFTAKNRNTALQYDRAGNVTADGSQLTYDATGQQTRARYTGTGGWDIQQGYDGDRQRVKKVEGGQCVFYLRSTVLGGQVVAEYNQTGNFTRGYVYDGNAQLLAVQQNGMVSWVHTDPVTKSKRVTDRQGAFVASIDVDPWGGETSRMENGGVLSQKYTTYERDGNGRDQAMMRSYHAWFSRFDQPDPFDGSYDLTDPQSFNRYAYVHNDPVNFIDPSGLFALPEKPRDSVSGIWGILIHFNPRGGGRPIRPRPVRLPDVSGSLELIDPDTINPFEKHPSYDECAKRHPGAPPSGAVSAILAASKATGASPTLIAVTWNAESSFNYAPMSNPNDGQPGNQDVGPMQINYRTYVNSPEVNGELGGSARVFGDVDGLSMTSEPFGGNYFSNVLAGARILQGYGKGRTAAGRYRTGTGPFSKKPEGKVEFENRAKKYDALAPGYDAFFKCLGGG